MGSTQSFQITKTFKADLGKVKKQTLYKHLEDTHIQTAVKNQSSYLLYSASEGMTLYNKGVKIWQEIAQNDHERVVCKDIKYIPNHNCYLIYSEDNILYRKDISRANHYQILKLKNCKDTTRQGDLIQYSKGLDKLVLTKGLNECLLFDLYNLKIFSRIQSDLGGEFFDHQLYGAKQDKVLALTQNGWLVAFDFGSLKPKLTQKYRIERQARRDEGAGPTISICNRSQYAFTQVYDQSQNPYFEASRFLIFKLGEREGEQPLTLLARLDVFGKMAFPPFFKKLHLLNRAEEDGSLVLFGLQSGHNQQKLGVIHFIEFTLTDKKLRNCNRENKTTAIPSRRILCFGPEFYSVDQDQRLARLEFSQD